MKEKFTPYLSQSFPDSPAIEMQYTKVMLKIIPIGYCYQIR